MHPSEEIFNDANRQCRDLLTDAEYQEAFEFSERHGEYGLAIETLADILIEKNVKLNGSQLKAISEVFLHSCTLTIMVVVSRVCGVFKSI